MKNYCLKIVYVSVKRSEDQGEVVLLRCGTVNYHLKVYGPYLIIKAYLFNQIDFDVFRTYDHFKGQSWTFVA